MKRLLLALLLALPLFGQGSTTTWRGDAHGRELTADSPIERSYYDGCNWCRCVGEICSCTLMDCTKPLRMWVSGEPNPILAQPYEEVFNNYAKCKETGSPEACDKARELVKKWWPVEKEEYQPGLLRRLLQWLW